MFANTVEVPQFAEDAEFIMVAEIAGNTWIDEKCETPKMPKIARLPGLPVLPKYAVFADLPNFARFVESCWDFQIPEATDFADIAENVDIAETCGVADFAETAHFAGSVNRTETSKSAQSAM